MMLEEILKGIVSGVEGGLSALIMGLDGLTVAQYQAVGETGIETIAVEYCSVLKHLIQLSRNMDQGIFKQISVVTSKYQLLCSMVSPEYFLLLLMSEEGNFGKGKYLMKLAGRKIKKEL